MTTNRMQTNMIKGVVIVFLFIVLSVTSLFTPSNKKSEIAPEKISASAIKTMHLGASSRRSVETFGVQKPKLQAPIRHHMDEPVGSSGSSGFTFIIVIAAVVFTGGLAILGHVLGRYP